MIIKENNKLNNYNFFLSLFESKLNKLIACFEYLDWIWILLYFLFLVDTNWDWISVNN